jgi:predicted ATP-grasp superfamily ATP-dependent carboligase
MQGDCGWPLGKSCGRALRQAGFSPEDFLIQEFMPEADVISTCGFFDTLNHSRNLFLTTRKLLGLGGRLTTGVVVETIPDPGGLASRTAAILDALRYRGPFEMEFVEGRRRGMYHVLELNMRFWMQHGLFIDGCGNRLLERYLDRDDPRPDGTPPEANVQLV